MKTFKQILNEGSSIGNDGKFNYAIRINGLDSQEFYKQPFGRQLPDRHKVDAFKASAKTRYVGAKGKATLTAVKAFLNDYNPKEFFAKWQMDSSHYKDDSVEIFYK